MNKMLKRAANLLNVLCGFCGAAITLAIVCACTDISPIWLAIPVGGALFLAFYIWGVFDTLNTILDEELKEENNGTTV